MTTVDRAASQLSALVDGELADAEIDLVLRRLLRDAGGEDALGALSLDQRCMQGHLPDAFDAGFATRIRQVIEAEPPLRASVKPLSTWYKPVTGFGLAASVVLVGAVRTPADPEPARRSALSSLSHRRQQGRRHPAASPARRCQAGQPPADSKNGGSVDARLNNYLVNHNNYASLNSVNGMLPYVRMVGYQADR